MRVMSVLEILTNRDILSAVNDRILSLLEVASREFG
jgi:hypothetical protein